MATTTLATYSPSDLTISIILSNGDSHIIGGYAEDSHIRISMPKGTFTKVTSADNQTSRIYNPDTSCTCEISLAQTSASNLVLDSIYQNDKITKQGIFKILIKDNSGMSFWSSDSAFIGDLPDVQFGRSLGNLSWSIHMHNTTHMIGGNTVLSTEDASVVNNLGVNIPSKWRSN